MILSKSEPRRNEDDNLLLAFEECRLTPELWTHEAHVQVARGYLSRFSFPRALQYVCSGIKKLNAHNGKPNAYHETITVAMLLLVADRMDAKLHESWEQFKTRNADLLNWKDSALLNYYTYGTLYSDEARQHFIWPDKRPLLS